jgi:hypothetical protein
MFNIIIRQTLTEMKIQFYQFKTILVLQDKVYLKNRLFYTCDYIFILYIKVIFSNEKSSE